MRHLAISDTIGDILGHPEFAGFAPLILPWDGRAYDAKLPIMQIGTLLPYHSYVIPQDVLGGLNRMIEDVRGGRQVFYRIYSDRQTLADTTQARAGLFFFRGKPGAPFAVIAPGGGFAYVGSVHEGFPYALDIAANGYNAFVIRYRAGLGGETATRDMAAAISFILSNAGDLEVSADSYAVWGSSAGARMAAAIGTRGVAAYGGSDVAKPQVVVMAYTSHSDYGANEPPTFAVVGENDAIAPPSAMRRRIEALRRQGTMVEYKECRGLGHGFGRGTGTSADGWIVEAVGFWERTMR